MMYEYILNLNKNRVRANTLINFVIKNIFCEIHISLYNKLMNLINRHSGIKHFNSKKSMFSFKRVETIAN